MTMDLETLCGRYAKSIKRKTMFLADSDLPAPFYSTSLNVKTASVVASALAFALDIINAKQAELDALKGQNLELLAEKKRLQEKSEHSTLARFNWRKKYLDLIGSIISTLGVDELTARDDVVIAVKQLKADAARYRYIKRHVNQENEELGCPSGTEISFYEWDEVSGTGYDSSEYDELIDSLIAKEKPACAYAEGSIECRNGFLYDAAGEYDPTDRSKPCPLCGEKAK